MPLPVPERVLSQFSGYRTMTWQNRYGKYSVQQGDAISGEYMNALRHYWQQKALKTCSRDRTFTYYVYAREQLYSLRINLDVFKECLAEIRSSRQDMTGTAECCKQTNTVVKPGKVSQCIVVLFEQCNWENRPS